MEMVEDLVIVGSGIGGQAIALALAKVGINVFVVERSDGLRATSSIFF